MLSLRVVKHLDVIEHILRVAGPQLDPMAVGEAVESQGLISDLLLVENQQTENRSLCQCPNFGGPSSSVVSFYPRH